MRKILVLIVLTSGMMFGQQKTPVAKLSVKQPTESAEHKAAQAALEVWDSGESHFEHLQTEIKGETTLIEMSTKANEIKELYDYTVNYIKKHPDEDESGNMGLASRQANQYKEAVDAMVAFKQQLAAFKTEYEEKVKLLKQRLEYVDSCVKVYRVTIDMKPSDLTIRQNEQIKGCRSLDLYPPPSK